MKPVTMGADVWWLARPDDIRPVKGLSIHDIVTAIQGKFGFAAFPTALPAKDQGLTFREGVFRDKGKLIPIKVFDLFNDGIHIAVDSSTDDADIVFSELRRIFVELGGKEVNTVLLHYHVSTIVCDFDESINWLISDFLHLTSVISSHLEIDAKVGVTGINFAADPSTLPTRIGKINPTHFSLEPRTDYKFEEKRYYSVANMTTSKHIELLTYLDRKGRVAT
jgi:hypothetical protein